MAPVVLMEGVEFSYGRELILENVNLSIGEQEFLTVVGPNGGGKTTLLKLMLGLEQPLSGKVSVLGMRPEKARPFVGYVTQFFHYDPSFPVSVMDVIRMGRLGTGFRVGRFRREDDGAALEALGEVGLSGLERRPFSQLSGGQRQRVLVARAICSNPKLLLLDEPTSNVDAATQRELFELLDQLSRRLTILMVTHDVGFVSAHVKRAICVNRKVHIHPTAGLTGDLVTQLYGTEVRMVRHDMHVD